MDRRQTGNSTKIIEGLILVLKTEPEGPAILPHFSGLKPTAPSVNTPVLAPKRPDPGENQIATDFMVISHNEIY